MFVRTIRLQKAGNTLEICGSGAWGWPVTFFLIFLGFFFEFKEKREYITIHYHDTVRISQRPPNPPIPAILTTILAIYAGFKCGESSLIIGSVSMMLLAAIPQSKVGPLLGQIGEVILMWGTWKALSVK